MQTYYIYEVNRTRAWSMDECGLFTNIYEEEKPPFLNDRYHDEEYKLLGTFQAHDYNGYGGELQIKEGGPIHELQGLHGAPYSVSVEEAALMLGLSEQRIRALLVEESSPQKIRGRKVSGIWLIQATELRRFASVERPAHRPTKDAPMSEETLAQ